MSKNKRKIYNFENNTDEVFIDLPQEDNLDFIEEDNLIEEDDFIEEKKEDEKIERCKVVFIKDKNFIIDFKGYGINIVTYGLIDKDLIHTYIDVKYKGDIGESGFEYFPIF